MIDHILEHLDLAEGYEANASRIAALRCRSKQSRDHSHRCCQAANRERAQAAAHSKSFSIDPLVVVQEHATWRRLRQYSLDFVEALTVADLCWLRAVVHHGRSGSRNVKRAAELFYIATAFFGSGSHNEPSPTMSSELGGLGDDSTDGGGAT